MWFSSHVSQHADMNSSKQKSPKKKTFALDEDEVVSDVNFQTIVKPFIYMLLSTYLHCRENTPSFLI